tara:strand:+ start:145 stop:759 length:615 start_codon:yes stop_codon:yes gene_type:complete
MGALTNATSDDWDACAESPVVITTISMCITLVVVGLAVVLLRAFHVGNDSQRADVRFFFHAARVGPWTALIGALIPCIVLDTISFLRASSSGPFEDALTRPNGCVAGYQCATIGLFVSLLLTDLIMFVLMDFVRALTRKPLMVFHHLFFISWLLCTVSGVVPITRVVLALSGLEEGQEALASISYLKKDSPNQFEWRLGVAVSR